MVYADTLKHNLVSPSPFLRGLDLVTHFRMIEYDKEKILTL